MLTELEIINSMLRTIGIGGLTSNDTQHPDYTEAKAVLDDALRAVNSLGYWYNTSYPSLSVTSKGEFILPSNTLSCDPIDRSKNYIQRSTRLFDMGGNTFTFAEDVLHVKLVLNLTVEELPPKAQQYVQAMARTRFYGDNDGEESRYRRYMAQQQETWAVFFAENLNNRDNNALDSLSARMIRRGHRGNSSEHYTATGYRSR